MSTLPASLTFLSVLKRRLAILSMLSPSRMGSVNENNPVWGWLFTNVSSKDGSFRNKMNGAPKIRFKSKVFTKLGSYLEWEIELYPGANVIDNFFAQPN